MLELILDYRDEAQRIASLFIGLAMWRWGGIPEKIISSAFIILFTLPLSILNYTTAGSFILGGHGYIYVIIDVLAFFIFVSVALNANRNYPLWIAAFQLVALAAHGVRTMVDTVSPLAYAIMVITPSYFQLVLMAVGLIRHVRRKKRYGEYRDWRISPQQPWSLTASSSGPRGGI